MRVCRWGILSTAEIGQKNWKAILNAPSATLTAVASRDHDRAARFVQRLQAAAPFATPPAALGAYESLLESADVDAVYLPIPTGLRTDWAVRCAAAGKHVLVEKPAATNSAELSRVIDACHAHQVQLMDGVMFMHSARFAALRAVLDDGETIGKVRRISSGFSFCADDRFFQHNIRASAQLEPLGCLGDLGWYAIRFALWALKWQLPRQVSGRILQQSDAGVPIEFSCELLFRDVSAELYCSFITAGEQWAVVTGTRGSVRLDDFVLPIANRQPSFITTEQSFHIDNCNFDMRMNQRLHQVKEDASGTPNSQEALMIEEFSQLVLDGQPDRRWENYARNTQRVVDAVLQSARAGGELVGP